MGGIVLIALSVFLLMFQQPVAALIVAFIGVMLFRTGSAGARYREAAEPQVTESENEAADRRRRDTEEKERLWAEKERARCEWRDADSQDAPYEYECVGHPNRTLALRYGIANVFNEDREPDIDLDNYVESFEASLAQTEVWRPSAIRQASTIKLRKRERVSSDDEGTHYLAELPDFGNRKVRVVIQPGTEYVKTFYPMSEQWFERHADIEMILKDNPTFDLKELAMFHVQAVLNQKR